MEMGDDFFLFFSCEINNGKRFVVWEPLRLNLLDYCKNLEHVRWLDFLR